MRCSGFPLEDYGFYALGSLTGSERDEIEQHLAAGCETCREALAESNALWYSIGKSTLDAKPPVLLRRKVLHSVPRATPWWRRPMPAFAVATLIIAALVAGGTLGSRWSRPTVIAFSLASPGTPQVEPASPAVAAPKIIVKTERDPAQTAAIETLRSDLARERQKSSQLEADLAHQKTLLAATESVPKTAPPPPAGSSANEDRLQRTLEVVKARADELERQVVQYRLLLAAQNHRADQNMQLVSMMNNPAIRLVRMRSTEKGQGVEGHALIAGSKQIAFFASGLPLLPPGKIYQLWVVRSAGAPVVSAGLFRPDAGHQAFLTVDDPALLANATAFAVTDEPAQGSALPTGHKWMIGS